MIQRVESGFAASGAMSWIASWRSVCLATVVMAGAWYGVFLRYGPSLAINHDELNFLHDALRLLGQGRLSGYAHGPLLYEMLAILEAAWYVVGRATGTVASSGDFLTSVLTNEHAHLLLGRGLVAVTSLALLAQLYRLGRLFGDRRVAALAVVLCAANVTFVALSSVIKEDPLYWLLVITALLEAWRAVERDDARLAVLAGAAGGAAFATKYLAVFTFAIVLLPFFRMHAGLRRAIRLAAGMAVGIGVAVVVLMPFLVTDTRNFFDSLARLDALGALGGHRAIWTYLSLHLPNLLGWPIFALGIAGLAMFAMDHRRGALLLVAVPVAQLVFLGARSGFSAAYYVFPLALFLFVSASALVVRAGDAVFRTQGAWVAATALSLLAMVHHPYLPATIKHGLILTAPDVRLLARDFLHRHAKGGQCVLVTHGLVGMNFFGPPILPQSPPSGAGPFAAATRQALDRAVGPRYRLVVVDGVPDSLDRVARDCDWVVTMRIGKRLTAELGSRYVEPERNPPANFVLAATIRSAVEPQAVIWPYLTSLDYDELRAASLRTLWDERVQGFSLLLYRRASLRIAG